MVEGYASFQEKIMDTLSGRGFRISQADEIAKEVIKSVKTHGGHYSRRRDIVGFNTSKYHTLRDFIDVLKTSSFRISNKTLQRMVRKFEVEGAIKEVNIFCEKIRNKEIKKAQLQELLHPVSNEPEDRLASIRNLLKKERTPVAEFMDKIKNQGFGGIFNRFVDIILVTAKNAFGAGMFLNVYNNFEAMVGPIPLGSIGIDSPTSIQSIEVAHSNKIVKFRAVGSIFLAHQLGGKDSVQITGKFTGSTRFFWLSLLWLLTIISKGEVKTLDFAKMETIGSNKVYDLFRQVGVTPTPLEKIDGAVVEAPSYIKHVTFPVVLNHEIITNCYIETFSFEETIDGKKDVINYDLLLRTYDEPNDFIADNENTTFGARSSSKLSESMKYFINFTWRTLKQTKEIFIDTSSWKLRGYYDIDPVDMGFTMALGFMGGI